MSTKPLSSAVRDRLAKLVPLLGSPVSGEVAAAAAAITRALTAAGNDWHDFTAHVCGAPATQRSAPRREAPEPKPRDFYQEEDKTMIDPEYLIRVCNQIIVSPTYFLNASSRSFLESMIERAQHWRNPEMGLSFKQVVWLSDLARRARVPFNVKRPGF